MREEWQLVAPRLQKADEGRNLSYPEDGLQEANHLLLSSFLLWSYYILIGTPFVSISLLLGLFLSLLSKEGECFPSRYTDKRDDRIERQEKNPRYVLSFSCLCC